MTLPLTLSVFGLALCVLFFFYFRWYIKRNTAAEQLLAAYRTEVYRLIAEIDAATDRDSLLVEERIKTLKNLLEDTDKRIAVYVRELERSRSGEAMYANLGRGIRAALNSPLPPPALESGTEDSRPSPPYTDVSRVKTGGRKRAPGPSVGVPELPGQQPAAKPRLKAQIAVLAAEGLDPGEIASRLRVSLSEVDLALNLLIRKD